MSRGFTLIELLVVIAIIGMLSSVALASFTTTRAKARNVARDEAIGQLQRAFNLALSTNDFPSSDNTYRCVSYDCYDGWDGYTADPEVDTFLDPYIEKPTDPQGGSRGIGGFLYFDPATWGGTAQFPAGYYLNWTLEPGATDCGPGGAIYTQTATYVQCLLRLN